VSLPVIIASLLSPTFEVVPFMYIIYDIVIELMTPTLGIDSLA
jgi:hypothetical protein